MRMKRKGVANDGEVPEIYRLANTKISKVGKLEAFWATLSLYEIIRQLK